MGKEIKVEIERKNDEKALERMKHYQNRLKKKGGKK